MTDAPGIYVHIPFCLRRCDYCDFTTFADRDEAIPAYVSALCDHIERTTASHDQAFGSVFVGGGTPTYLRAADLTRILATIRSAFTFTTDAEWTVEANPETITEEMAEALPAAGINRVSLGAQSFDDRVLSTLGRWHDPAAVDTAITLLGDAGVERLSLDLIFGTPGETDRSWQRSLDRTLAMGVRHLSAYALTVEPNTSYAVRARREPALVPDEDIQATRMEMAERTLTTAGLARYEISNWAHPGQECRHNLTYWRGGQWLAFGSGAHGAWDGRRYWLVRDPDKYARMVREGVEPLGGEEYPDPDQVRLERLMMGLRLVEGVPRKQVEPVDDDLVTLLRNRGLLTSDPNRLVLTDDGRPLADRVVRQLA